MDWVQWYLAVLLTINLLATVALGIAKPDEHPPTTYGVKAMLWPISTLFSLPFIGRVFGWW